MDKERQRCRERAEIVEWHDAEKVRIYAEYIQALIDLEKAMRAKRVALYRVR